MATGRYQLEEGEILERRNVPEAIDELSTSSRGGLYKAEGTASKYLDLLVYTLKSGSIRNLSIVLTAIKKIQRKSLLEAIIKSNGLHILLDILSVHQHSFQMTPILRITLGVLQHMEQRGVLRGSNLTCHAPDFCVPEFAQVLFDLTKHPDHQVQVLASKFQKLRFDMHRHHPNHSKCK